MSARTRRGVSLRLLRRWWGLLGLAVQREVAWAISRGAEADLAAAPLEPPPRLAELAA